MNGADQKWQPIQSHSIDFLLFTVHPGVFLASRSVWGVDFGGYWLNFQNLGFLVMFSNGINEVLDFAIATMLRKTEFTDKNYLFFQNFTFSTKIRHHV
jgi:hypothetical protein